LTVRSPFSRSDALITDIFTVTSHEMRNPLSAIVHCSDAIIASLAKGHELVERHFASPSTTVEGPGGSRATISQLITDSIENAETIVACAQHQKRIVDDILTMSKLDSKLLAVTPCTVNPVQIGFEAIKMFDVEARRVDIDLTMTIDSSFTDMGHKYLDLDPSRVKQVLINLLTNALKFTKSGSTRTVAVSMKASIERPTDQTSAVTFIPRSCTEESEYDQPALEGRRDPVYLLFEVKDTGQGLTEEEKANLFNRFVQASSRTHVMYGGSGLGLFISRRLTELQKGAIGVSSMPGVGSTFAFYIETYVPSEESRLEAELAAALLKVSRQGQGQGQGQGGSTSPTGAAKTRAPSLSQRPKQPPEDKNKNFIDGILVVEDNLINQQITRRGLHDRGFKVQVANHGIEALEKLSRSAAHHEGDENIPPTESEDASSEAAPPAPINFILMDIEMPIQDGLTCTRRIRELESQGKVFGSGGRIPIIAVSANARPEQMRQAIDAGCDDVVVKPYRMPELIDTMQVVVKRMTTAEQQRRQGETKK
jgi:signal transduction histidine kinase/CheY-like chemotaxis protein